MGHIVLFTNGEAYEVIVEPGCNTSLCAINLG